MSSLLLYYVLYAITITSLSNYEWILHIFCNDITNIVISLHLPSSAVVARPWYCRRHIFWIIMWLAVTNRNTWLIFVKETNDQCCDKEAQLPGQCGSAFHFLDSPTTCKGYWTLHGLALNHALCDILLQAKCFTALWELRNMIYSV